MAYELQNTYVMMVSTNIDEETMHFKRDKINVMVQI